MVDLYAEYGVIGVVVILFAGMLTWFKGFVDKLVNNKMEDLENEILLEMAENQAEKMQDEAMGFLASKKFEKEVASKINEKIDIPFVSEAKEQIFFEKVVDVVTDLLQGVFKGK